MVFKVFRAQLLFFTKLYELVHSTLACDDRLPPRRQVAGRVS